MNFKIYLGSTSRAMADRQKIKRERWKYKNLNISRTKRAFWMKWTFFIVSKGLMFGENKNLIKNGGHKL